MFRRLPDEHINRAPEVSIVINGQPCTAREGDSVAAAMLAAGHAAFRTTAVTGAPRGPYCMLGTCFECLVVIDGRQNQQACLTPVRAGMTIELQQGARSVRLEVPR
jgi:D-hydroxyproline dehydrogenase subunit gamma